MSLSLSDGRWIEARIRPVPKGCVVVYSDVTMRKSAEDALHNLNRQLKLLAKLAATSGSSR